jgi:hypothetical protein
MARALSRLPKPGISAITQESIVLALQADSLTPRFSGVEVGRKRALNRFSGFPGGEAHPPWQNR